MRQRVSFALVLQNDIVAGLSVGAMVVPQGVLNSEHHRHQGAA
jgi:MFS superfamily sulfate permease-like transporter